MSSRPTGLLVHNTCNLPEAGRLVNKKRNSLSRLTSTLFSRVDTRTQCAHVYIYGTYTLHHKTENMSFPNRHFP